MNDKLGKYIELQIEALKPEVTHRCPVGDSNECPCCGLTPFELSSTDRITVDPRLVTCPGTVSGELMPGGDA